jgi:hypothetical protein
MDSVTVSVDDLFQSLKENKKKHDKILKEAQKGYWKRCKECLVEARKAAMAKDPNWPDALSGVSCAPEDHSGDYDSAIKMLEMCANETIEVSRQDFEAFVMNKWHWRKSFLLSNSCYMAATGSTGPTGSSGPEGLDF